MEPFPDLNDPTLEPVKMGMHIYHLHTSTTPLATLQREPDIPARHDPLQTLVCQAHLASTLSLIPQKATTSTVPITFASHQAEHLLYRVVRLIRDQTADSFHHPAFQNGTLTRTLSEYFTKHPTSNISPVRSINPSRLRAELKFLLSQALIPHISENPRLTALLKDFQFKHTEEKEFCQAALERALRGPRMKRVFEEGQGLVWSKIWPKDCHIVGEGLMQEAEIESDENEEGLKMVGEIWRVWGEVVGLVVRGLVWVDGARGTLVKGSVFR
jgi:hypothetical protein